MKPILIIILFLSFAISYAQDAPLGFVEPDKQEKYQALLGELRCLVCQNQSLADSPAGTAQDLRKIIYNMVEEGQSNDAIIDFLVARYGDFVLYNPRLKASTALLWLGPFVLLIVALFIAYRYVRKSSADNVEMTEQDKARAAKLLSSDATKDPGR
jgi:cytochrome c-type biogenesis protein CcmH